jgi:hypothetical protein
LAACAGLPKEALPEPFVRVSQKESIPAFQRRKPALDINLNLVDVSAPGPLQSLVRDLLYKKQSAAEYVLATSSDLSKEYRETAAEYPDSDQDWNYDEDQKLVRAGTSGVITRHISSYTGGAHPNWTETSYVLDLEKSRQIRLAELFTRTGLAALRTLTDRELRNFSTAAGEPIPAGTPLSNGVYFENSVAPSEDFYPTEKGLTFQWDPYEIAPYAVGGVEITLSWQELADLFGPEGKKLAAAFGK